MRRVVLLGLLSLLALSLANAALLTPPTSPTTRITLRTAAIDFNLNYSDPASDVFELWTSNNSHVTTAGGAWVMSPFPGSVNLIHLSSLASGGNLLLSVRVQSAIATQPNTTYDVRLYTTSDNSTYYILRYSDGSTTLRSNHTGSVVTSLGGTTISPATTLNLVVPTADLGTITAWNIDAATTTVGPTYTYEDFLWSIPGNPGSAPAAIQGRVTDAATGAGLAGVNASAAGYFTATNATGYYFLPAVPGTYTITFRLAGYQSASQPLSVSLDHTATVNAQLSKIPTGLAASVWVFIAVVIIAAVAIAAFALASRRRAAPPTK